MKFLMKYVDTCIDSNPSVVFIPDNEGKLPIHYLSYNDRILRDPQSKEMATSFANKLLTVYPESIVKRNNIGHIPFVHSIITWIDTELARKGDNVSVTPQLIPGLHPFFSTFPKGMFTRFGYHSKF